jgi:hypothetical protein
MVNIQNGFHYKLPSASATVLVALYDKCCSAIIQLPSSSAKEMSNLTAVAGFK